MKKKIIFRADASPEIGMGHVIRSLALADMLKNDFICEFATRFISDYVKEEVTKVCSKLHSLPKDNTHFYEFLNLLTGNEIVVLDNYFFDTEYQRKIKDKGCKLVCIDDMHDKHYVADVVINHAEGINKKNFSREKYTKLFLGLKYVLLNQYFLKKNKNYKTKIYDILIMIGGADPKNIILKIIKASKSIKKSLKFCVILGEAYQYNEQLIQNNNIDVFRKVSSEEVCDFMNKTKIGFFPASNSSMEACANRLAFVTGYFIENQINIYNGLMSKKLALCIGDFRIISHEQIKDAILELLNNSHLRDEIISNQKVYLDKKSSERFIGIFDQLSKSKTKKLTFRNATKYDIKLLFDWVNDPVVRQTSLNSKVISFDEHQKWFNDKIEDKDTHLLIFNLKKTPVGVVRFDIKENAIISISVDKKYRSKGLGKLLLKESIKYFFTFSDQTILAHIRKDNIASKKVFESVGFVFMKNDVINEIPCLILIKRKD